MQTSLILVCNASRAFLYEAHKLHAKEYLQFIEELTHTASRKKKALLVTDRPGHYQTDHKTRGAYEPTINTKEFEKNNFAKEIAEYLEKHHQNYPF